MSGIIWTKFYWSDWESDPALRVCSFAAQGLWMRLLCIAAGHEPIGYVAVAGRGLSLEEIARMVGSSSAEVSALLDELERNGVFSRDRLKRIYSRRMTKDAKKAAISVLNGKKGGNPTLSSSKEKSDQVNPHEPVPFPIPDKDQSVPTPKASAKSKRVRVPVPETDFPTAEAKAAAVIYWQNQGRPDLGRAIQDQVDQFLDHHKAHGKIMANWPAAWRTWVRNAPHMSRPPRHTLQPVSSAAAAIEPTLDTWVRRLEYFNRGNEDEEVDQGYWSVTWGPKPSQQGCKVPQEAFDAYAKKWPKGAVCGS